MNVQSVSLSRTVALRPGRFPVGLETIERPIFPPQDQVQGTAISVAAYLGRVDESNDSGEVTVTLWERPNGREGLTVLTRQSHFKDKPAPSVGDLLWIWTWIDVLPNGASLDRFYTEIETRTIGDEERKHLELLVLGWKREEK